MSHHEWRRGLSLEQRVVQINRLITEVLSMPGTDRRTIAIAVRPLGPSATIVVGDITVITAHLREFADYYWTRLGKMEEKARRSHRRR